MGLVIVHDFHHFFKPFRRFSSSSPPYGSLALGLVRSMCLALLFLSFTWLSFLRFGVASTAKSLGHVEESSDSASELLPLLCHDLEKEGLLRLGDKTLFIRDKSDELSVSGCSHIVNRNEMFLVSPADEQTQSTMPSESFDFAFTNSRHVGSAEFIDRTLKNGGIFVIQLKDQESLSSFLKPSNYEIVYLRRFQSTIMAMRKTGYAEAFQKSFAKRRLLEFTEENKKRALSKLEDVLLEPPRASSRKSRTYLKRTRYLPDLMGDSFDLKNYPRRVFIDVGAPEKGGGAAMKWFAENYPTRNLEFEFYKIETMNEDKNMNLEIDSVPQEMGMSEWLKDNVKEEEYVVMKAEAEMVEEMVRGKAIKLVDELFMECKPKSTLGFGGRKSQSNFKNGRRAYWECLALYGKLRDEGVAVHQWWG